MEQLRLRETVSKHPPAAKEGYRWGLNAGLFGYESHSVKRDHIITPHYQLLRKRTAREKSLKLSVQYQMLLNSSL